MDRFTKDHAVSESWTSEASKPGAQDSKESEFWADYWGRPDIPTRRSHRSAFFHFYSDLYKRYPMDLAGVSEPMEVAYFRGRGMGELPPGLTARAIPRIKIVEPSELTALVKGMAEDRLRPEILRREIDPLEGAKTRRFYDNWIAREAWGQFLPDLGEIWLSRDLVGFDSVLLGDSLLRSLVHELIHFVQWTSGTTFDPKSNTILAEYLESRHLLPAESLQTASQWVSRHYSEDL